MVCSVRVCVVVCGVRVCVVVCDVHMCVVACGVQIGVQWLWMFWCVTVLVSVMLENV